MIFDEIQNVMDEISSLPKGGILVTDVDYNQKQLVGYYFTLNKLLGDAQVLLLELERDLNEREVMETITLQDEYKRSTDKPTASGLDFKLKTELPLILKEQIAKVVDTKKRKIKLEKYCESVEKAITFLSGARNSILKEQFGSKIS